MTPPRDRRARPGLAHGETVRGRGERLPQLSAAEQMLIRSARNGDRQAKRRLAVAYLDLTRAIASRYRGLGLPIEDLAQEGAIGLLEAIRDYDPRRSESFESYARFRIRRAIRNALTSQGRLVRLPKEVVGRRRLLARAEARLAAAGTPSPSAEELAAESGLPLAAVEAAREAAVGVVPLQEALRAESAAPDGRLGNASSPDPEAVAIAHEEAARVELAVSALPSRPREILSRHFGLGRPPQPLTRVGPALQLSQQRARAIEREALYALRGQLDGPIEPRAPTARHGPAPA